MILATACQYQLTLPLYEAELAEVPDPFFRLILEGLIVRRLKDLRSKQRRAAALIWFERGECCAWCEAARIDFDLIMRKAEEMMEMPEIDYNRLHGAENT